MAPAPSGSGLLRRTRVVAQVWTWRVKGWTADFCSCACSQTSDSSWSGATFSLHQEGANSPGTRDWCWWVGWGRWVHGDSRHQVTDTTERAPPIRHKGARTAGVAPKDLLERLRRWKGSRTSHVCKEGAFPAASATALTTLSGRRRPNGTAHSQVSSWLHLHLHF